MALNTAQLDILEGVRDEYKTADDDHRKIILKSTLRSFIHLDGKRTTDFSNEEKNEMFIVCSFFSNTGN
jgi:hypothetical protein